MSAPKGGSRRVPAPPATLECNLGIIPRGTIIHRIHDRGLTGDSFNPGFGSSRFAPFSVGGATIPTSYAATSLPCAVFESIFHDINPNKAIKSIRVSRIEHLDYSVLELRRDLKLAKLFTPDLAKWKLTRAQLIDTSRSQYSSTRAWSPPIHEAPQSPEGMMWTSRACDEDKAMMLFGSRVNSADLKLISTVKVTSDPACWEVVEQQGARADILIAR